MENLAVTKDTVQRIDDTLQGIRGLTNELNRHLSSVRAQRERHPQGEPYLITEKNLARISEQFQQIREYGERFDFNTFTNVMDNAEDLLKKLRMPVQFRRADIIIDLLELLDGLEQAIAAKAKNADARAGRKK
jgi:molecular chaperone GrpE (heat shock protein)